MSLQKLIMVSPDFSPFSLTTLQFPDFSKFFTCSRKKLLGINSIDFLLTVS